MSFNQRFPRPGMGMFGNGGGMRPMMGGRGFMNQGGAGGFSGLLPTPGGRGGMMNQRGGMGMGRGGMNMGRGGNMGPQRGRGGFGNRGGPQGGPRPPIGPTAATPPEKKETEGEPPAKKKDTTPEEQKKTETKDEKKVESTPVKAEKDKKEDKPSTPATQSGGAKPPAPLATSTPTSTANSPASKANTPQSLMDMKVPNPGSKDGSSADKTATPPWKRTHDGGSTLEKNQNKPGGGPNNASNNTRGGRGGGRGGMTGRGAFFGRPSRDPELDVEDNSNAGDTDVSLDRYNSDLHFKIHPDGFTAEAITEPNGFCFCWSGGRANYGVTKGKICYEVLVSEYLPVDFGDDHQEEHPHVVRIGWSLDSTSFQLGEEPLSYGYGGTGRFSTNLKFTPYGEEFGQGDVILAMVDLEARPPNISYAKNGRWLGVALPLHRWPVGVKEKALFPHVLSKNCKLEVNFGQRPPWYPPPPSFTYVRQVPLNLRVRGLLPPAKQAECEMIMMCGLPGTGKTTWALNFAKDHPEKRYNIIGTDSLIDKMKVMGLPRKRNFGGRWDVLIKKSTACLNKLFDIAGKEKRNLVLDQTNVYPSARRRKMRSFTGFQRKIAVLVPTDEEMRRRSEKRTREEGKEIPESAVLEMKANFKLPEDSDEFLDEIMWIEHSREAAQPIIDAYNKEGAAKVAPNKIHQPFNPRGDRGRDHRDSRSDSRDHSRDHRSDRDRSSSRHDSRDSRHDNRYDSRDGRSDSRDRGSSSSDRDRSHSRDRDGKDPKSDDHKEVMGPPSMGRGRGGFDRGGRGMGDRGRGGRGGFTRPGEDKFSGGNTESDSGYDSERSDTGFGRGWGGDRGRGADRGRGGAFGRGDRGRGGMGGGSWGRGGNFDNMPWKQESDVEIEPLFPGGRGRGRGRGGHDNPPWRGMGPESEMAADPSQFGQPPEKKIKQEQGSGLDAIKQEYEDPTPPGRTTAPPLMGSRWSAGGVKEEPKDQSTGDSNQGRRDQHYGGPRDPPGGPRPDVDSRDRAFGGRGDVDRRFGGPEDQYGQQGRGGQYEGGRDRGDSRYGQNRPDSYGGPGMGERGGYGGPGQDRNRYGQQGEGRPGDRGFGGDNRPGDGRPGSRYAGDNRQGEGRYGESGGNRHGEGRPGDRHPYDNQYGESRDAYGNAGDTGYGKDRQDPGMYGRPGGPNQYGQDAARDQGSARPDYSKPPPPLDQPAMGMDRSRDMYGRPGQGDGQEKPPGMPQDRDYSGPGSRWGGGPPESQRDWREGGNQWGRQNEGDNYRGRDQQRDPSASRWGAPKQEEYGRGSMNNPSRSSRWEADNRQDNYGNDPNEPPSTQWPDELDQGGQDSSNPSGRDAGGKGPADPASQSYGYDYGYSRPPPSAKDSYGQPKDSDSRDYYNRGRWSDQPPADPGYKQDMREPPPSWDRAGRGEQQPRDQHQQQQQRWDSSWSSGGQADRSYGADPQSSARTSTASSQPPTSWGSQYGDAYGKGQSWAAKPPPPPPPADKTEAPKAPETSQQSAWSHYGYYGYEDATKGSTASKTEAQQQSEWAEYWRQQDTQTTPAQHTTSVESWSTTKTSEASKSADTKAAAPPPPQQTWAWGPQGWQLTSSSTSTTASVSSSSGGIYQPPPPPPPEDDTQKKKKSRWGVGQPEEPKTTQAYTPSASAAKDAYADYGRYDESAYASYSQAYSTEPPKAVQPPHDRQTSTAKTTTAASALPAAVTGYEGYGSLESYAAYTSTAASAVQQPKTAGAGLMGAYPSSDSADTSRAAVAAAADQAKLAAFQIPGAAGLTAMAGTGMAAQALVGAPVMTPALAATAMPGSVAQSYLGLYQPAAAAAYGQGAAALSAAYRGRMPYQPR